MSKSITLGNEMDEYAGYFCIYDTELLEELEPRGDRRLLSKCSIGDVSLYGERYMSCDYELIYEELEELLGIPKDRLFLYHK